MKGRGTSRPRSLAGSRVLTRKATGQVATRGQRAQLFGLAVHAEAVSEGVEERAPDGRPLVLVQFHRRLHFGDKAETVGGEVVHSILLSDRVIQSATSLRLGLPPYFPEQQRIPIKRYNVPSTLKNSHPPISIMAHFFRQDDKDVWPGFDQ